MASKQPERRTTGMLGRVGASRLISWRPRRREPAVRAAPRRSRFGFSRSYSRGDLILFASGIVLSGFCAYFPWYVFLNQDQFGIRAVKLENIPSSGPAPRGAIAADRVASEEETRDNRETDLDTFTTGTTPPSGGEDEEPEPVEQPFPAIVPEFELVHVANGRAMIQDDQGLYVVQRGSLLPDNSRVAKIEKRNGSWVLVTTTDRVLEIVN
ncbi:MAG: hypothetical protein M9939_15925 [Mesorhizobium sp.]|nr:hypothetical protein [Mesorhizobium sp.]MCO5162622.1 hypothetical protein [Mesorhizobium sp.]